MIGIVHIESGELRTFGDLFWAQTHNLVPEGYELIEIPEGYPATLEWHRDTRDFGPIVAALDAQAVYDLFTAEEKAAILTCGVPQVMGLVMALQFTQGLIRATDAFHQQGVALLFGLGLLTEERAAQVAAMQQLGAP